MTHPKKESLAAFKNMPEGVPPKKNYKDPEGGVITEKPNFLTNPMKKGVLHGKRGQRGPFFDMPNELGNKYIESDYNVEKKILRDDWLSIERKLKQWVHHSIQLQINRKYRRRNIIGVLLIIQWML